MNFKNHDIIRICDKSLLGVDLHFRKKSKIYKKILKENINSIKKLYFYRFFSIFLGKYYLYDKAFFHLIIFEINKNEGFVSKMKQSSLFRSKDIEGFISIQKKPIFEFLNDIKFLAKYNGDDKLFMNDGDVNFLLLIIKNFNINLIK